ncbi:BTB/POZ domain-containing protein KCTD17 [Thecamonas trahens ATCC 50062]|uniref:BTB/POZ domain-containing protein KCTD17 n=1 Tax=Thecamonas trahens ATCC 50062 TaxID=461836 RepID=A0A0L0D9G8_THETB|nr:BTB/POZ domain-containing protein KCTD17 [Thecamonas trahens ATCC 50062]XP_013762793.1 BTB/POZ domain-containing protein KCTD17 [Thecamonas trahens ATCC 50062]KNC48701.1 BTB/POZ domain-containing protein KCTD17 [Thecamonas trahens ATCC 50062]KNC48741.1 BTB/POZ domain-containing protein KCTD17 [Thecamonas trahens ATCC 50062]|eukprot:XP_013762757.1 BTB/POZ domain-containing protein KCTD17 [Thecamonas trahens ATCC 50062]
MAAMDEAMVKMAAEPPTMAETAGGGDGVGGANGGHGEHESDSEWIQLNVGGTMFATTRTTLRMEPSSMLAALASGEWVSTKDETGAILLDRDPAFFGPILNYLRMGKLIVSPSISYKGVLEEAKFFDLPSLVALLSPLSESKGEAQRKHVTTYTTIKHTTRSHDSQFQYSVYPILVKGPIEPAAMSFLNGGTYPPAVRVFPASTVYGDPREGWYIKNHSLADVFNTAAAWGWELMTSSGDGSGGSWGQESSHIFVFRKVISVGADPHVAAAVAAAHAAEPPTSPSHHERTWSSGSASSARARGERQSPARPARSRRAGQLAVSSRPITGVEVVSITDETHTEPELDSSSSS